MPEFIELLPPEEALSRLFEYFTPVPIIERIETENALGRIVLKPIVAPHPLPTFSRSTVDGYAVKAQDTYSASGSLPVYLKMIGEVNMGEIPKFEIASTQCALIHTGGMLPEGSNAVAMVENTQQVSSHEIEVLVAVAMGENVILEGEDVVSGEELVPAGTRIREAEIGGLMALGVTQIQVARTPRVGIISSGDELIPPQQFPLPGQVRDVNTYSLKALIERNAGLPVSYGILPDDYSKSLMIVSKAFDECDFVIITAGSSASTRDLTSQIIQELGHPGILVHGVNIKPGKPTILAVCQNKVVIGLPGNPVSALVIARIFVIPVLEALQGLKKRRPNPIVHAHLASNLSSKAGREEWVPVILIEDESGYLAEPIFSKSNLIFSLVRADGIVHISADATGISAGERVQVNII